MKKITTMISVWLFLFSVVSLYAVQGDVNGDGSVNINDALLIARYSAGLNPAGFQSAAADANCDSSININDALLIARYSAGLLSSFCNTTNSDAITFVRNLGIGWNLGNTLDACGDWIDKSSISNFEVAWGNPMTTKAMFDGLQAAGFKTIRIPVAWSNLMAADYTIHPDLLNRVAEVAGYALANGMYAIINLHWDGGWIANFSTQYDESMKRYRSFWTQISAKFRDFSDHLIFESLNEEGCWDDIWNRYSGTADANKTRAYNLLNTINQEFTNLVRASGGNNSTRYLLIAGYATDIDLTCDPLFHMPNDPVKHSIVSIHYYTPATFTILEADADWGKMQTTWGTAEEINALKNYMHKMKTTFIDKGIPVIMGEYGTTQVNKDPASVVKYITEVANNAYDAGMCPMLWDSTGGFYNRQTCTFTNPQVADMFRALADKFRP